MTAAMTDTVWMLRLVDLALALSLLEAAWLLARSGRIGWPRGPLLANLLAGLSLMLALRLGLSGAGLPWVAACLALAGLAHGLDLRARWRASRR